MAYRGMLIWEMSVSMSNEKTADLVAEKVLR